MSACGRRPIPDQDKVAKLPERGDFRWIAEQPLIRSDFDAILQLDLRGMLMRLSIGLIAAATIGTTGIALSADLPIKGPAYAPPAAAPYNWRGSYIGGNFGYAWGSDPINLTPGTAFPGTVPLSLADNPRGVLGGIQYGTNWQFNRFVLGWDSDFSFSDIKASQTAV